MIVRAGLVLSILLSSPFVAAELPVNTVQFVSFETEMPSPPPIKLVRTQGQPSPSTWIKFKASWPDPGSQPTVVLRRAKATLSTAFLLESPNCNYQNNLLFEGIDLQNGSICQLRVTLTATEVGTYDKDLVVTYRMCSANNYDACTPFQKVALPVSAAVIPKPVPVTPKEEPIVFPDVDLHLTPFERSSFYAKPGASYEQKTSITMPYSKTSPLDFTRFFVFIRILPTAGSEFLVTSPWPLTSGLTIDHYGAILDAYVNFKPTADGDFNRTLAMRYKVCVLNNLQKCGAEKEKTLALVGTTKLKFPVKIRRKPAT